MTEDFVVEWDDVHINPLRQDVFVPMTCCQRDKVILFCLIPCVRLVASQEEVASLFSFEPVTQRCQICSVCLFESTNFVVAKQGVVFTS